MKDGRLRVLQLVNEANDHLQIPISLDTVTMATPEKKVDGAGVGRNTGIVISGIVGMGYKGSTEIFFNRLDLNELFDGADITANLRTNGTITAEWVLDQLNKKYGLYLDMVDVKGIEVPEFIDLETTQSIEIVVKEDSWNWMGTVTVETTYGNPLIETVVLVRLLPILTHPEDLDEMSASQRSGYMTTYNFDFTAYKDELQINPTTGRWENFNRVLEIGALAGLPSWNNQLVQDLPTGAVPGANPAFERVMVQRYATGGVIAPLYFHYDLDW